MALCNEDAGTANLTEHLLNGDNAGDPGDALTIVSVDTSGTRGRIEFDAATQTLRYFADTGAFGDLATGASTNDFFTYTVRDAAGQTSTAQVRMVVTGTNAAPVAAADAGAVDEDATTGNLWNSLLANDSAGDPGDSLTIVSVDTAGTLGRVVFDAATQSLRYAADTPAFDDLPTGQTRVDTFRYTVRDAAGATSTAEVRMTVTGTGAPVVANADAVQVDEDAATGNLWQLLLGNDMGENIVIAQIDTSNTKGGITFNWFTKTLTYTANDDSFDPLGVGETAQDEFTYTITNPEGQTSTATVRVTVRGVANDVEPYITLTEGDDERNFDAGDQRIRALGGDDYVNAGAGNDEIDGGAGDDTLIGGDGNDKLEGGDGNDRLHGGTGADELYGGAGADELYAISGADRAYGEGGDDYIQAALGAAVVDGGTGTDRLTMDAGQHAERIEFNMADAAGVDGVTIAGTTVRNIESLGLFISGAGNDVITGGAFRDSIRGGLGNDHLKGEGDDDTLAGGHGDDEIDGGAGDDTLDGGEGDDRLVAGGGVDVIDGGAGDDWAVIDRSAATADIVFRLDDPTVAQTLDDGTTVVNVEHGHLTAGAGDDYLFGGSGADELHGGDGDDRLYGGNGTFGQGDRLFGGAGDDHVAGSQGDEVLDGGAGIDHGSFFFYPDERVTFSVASNLAPGGTTVFGTRISGFERVTFITGESGDVLTGGDLDDVFFTNDGDDDVLGSAGDDEVYAGRGRDLVAGGHGNDTVEGGDDDDVLDGNSGDDTLKGGHGDDEIDGGAGDDTLDGGEGSDVVAYTGNRKDYRASLLSDGRIEIVDLRNGSPNGTDVVDGVESFRFADRTMSSAEVLQRPNDAPRAANDAATAPQDGSVSIAVLANDTDPDAGDTLTVTSFEASTYYGGTVTRGQNGELVYTANPALSYLRADQHLVDTFTYEVRDAGGLSSTATVTVRIQGTNDAPTAQADTVRVYEDQEINLWNRVLSNDLDVDNGDTKTIVSVDSSGAIGTVQFDPAQQRFVYVANAAVMDRLMPGETMTDTVTYTMEDGFGARSTATATIVIEGLLNDDDWTNGDPNGGDLSGTEGGDLLRGLGGDDMIDAGAGDDIVEGGAGQDRIVGGDGGDTLDGGDGDDVIFGDGEAAAMTRMAFATSAEAFAAATPGTLGHDVINGGAGDDILTGGEGDDAIDGGEGADTGVFSGVRGDYEVELLDGGAVRITDTRDGSPDGSDTLTNVEAFEFANRTYTLEEVLKPNSAPSAIELDNASVEENAGAGALVGVVSGIDPDGDPLTYSLTDDAGGLFEIDAATGEITATRSLDRETRSSHEIVVRATDGAGLSFDRRFAIEVKNVNEAPVAVADRVAVAEDATSTNLWSQLLGNDADVDLGDVLSIASVDTSATKGSVVFDAATQSLRYVADADSFDLLATGQQVTDSFTYTVTDQHGATSTATVVIDVTGVADGRVIKGGNGKDTLTGTAGEDVITGLNGNDTLSGLGGADRLDGGNGNDVLSGGDGIDTLLGGNGDDKLDGGNGTDSLTGGLGQDQLVGGAGDDTLVGGSGHDLLTGGAGADTFVFGIGSDIDKILDFNASEDVLSFVDGAQVLFHDIRDTNQDGTLDTVLVHNLGGVVIVHNAELAIGSSLEDYMEQLALGQATQIA